MKSSTGLKHWVYIITVFLLVLSGFAQMPIFKRYYIADIPGFGWLADFYVTHLIHYLSASVLIGLFAYSILTFFLSGANPLTPVGKTRIALLSGLILTGSLMVFKNLEGVYFNAGLIIGLDLIHLGLCMTFLLVSFYALIRKAAWVSR